MQQTQSRGAAVGAWDVAYEWRAVTLLGIGFGLVGLDRWVIASLLPLGMAADLKLDELPSDDTAHVPGKLTIKDGSRLVRIDIDTIRWIDAQARRSRLRALAAADGSRATSLRADRLSCE